MAAYKAMPGTATSGPLAVLERVLHEGFATGNDAIVDEVFAPDLVEHQFGLAGVGATASFVVTAHTHNIVAIDTARDVSRITEVLPRCKCHRL